MSGRKPCPVIGELQPYLPAFEPRLLKMNTKRRRVYQSPYHTVILTLYPQTAPVYFPFSDYQDQIRFLKHDFRLWLPEIAFGKFLNLIFQV